MALKTPKTAQRRSDCVENASHKIIMTIKVTRNAYICLFDILTLNAENINQTPRVTNVERTDSP